MEILARLWGYVMLVWPLAIPIALPLLVELVSKCKASGVAKGWLAFGLSVAIGVVGVYASGLTLTPGSTAAFGGAVWAGSQLAYLAFKSSKVTSDFMERLLAIKVPLIN